MTPRQIYSELAKIGGYTCADGNPFLMSKKVLQSDLKHLQSHLRALLEKISYERTWHDFGRPMAARTRARVTRRPIPTIEEIATAPTLAPGQVLNYEHLQAFRQVPWTTPIVDEGEDETDE